MERKLWEQEPKTRKKAHDWKGRKKITNKIESASETEYSNTDSDSTTKQEEKEDLTEKKVEYKVDGKKGKKDRRRKEEDHQRDKLKEEPKGNSRNELSNHGERYADMTFENDGGITGQTTAYPKGFVQIPHGGPRDNPEPAQRRMTYPLGQSQAFFYPVCKKTVNIPYNHMPHESFPKTNEHVNQLVYNQQKSKGCVSTNSRKPRSASSGKEACVFHS